MPVPKKAYLIISWAILLWLVFPVNAQRINTFQKSFGTSNDEYCSSILVLPDRGFIISGITGTYPSFKILIIRTDSMGNKIWSKTYNKSGFSGTLSYKLPIPNINMVLAPDGNIVICSHTDINATTKQGHPYLFKINLNGNVLWSKTYSAKYFAGDSWIYSLINDPSGGFLMAGKSGYGASYGTIRIIKTDASGSMVWAKAYDDSTNCNISAAKIIASKNGGFLLCGSSNQFNHNYDNGFMVLKIDKSGNVLWHKVYIDVRNILDSLESNSIIELPDKRIYVYGRDVGANGEIWDGTLAKLDSTGHLLYWQEAYQISSNQFGNDIGILFTMPVYDSVKNVINIGFQVGNRAPGIYSSLNSIKGSVGIIRMDTTENSLYDVIFTKTYGPSSKYINSYIGQSITQLHSGGFAMLGSTNAFGAGGYDYFLVKTDINANSNNCYVNSWSYSNAGGAVYNQSHYINSKSLSLTVDTGCTVSSISVNDSIICQPFVAAFGWQKACIGQPVYFLDSSYYKPTNWQWDFGDAGSSSNTSALQNPTHIYKFTGTYKVRLISGNGIVKDTAIKTVIVYPLPVNFIFDTLICAGNSINLLAKGGAQYRWRPNKLFTDSTLPNPSVLLTKTTNFVLVAITANNCATYDTLHVTVDGKPNLTLLEYATVKSNNEIDLRFQKSLSNDVKFYFVLRSDDEGTTYHKIAEINNLSNSDINYLYKDDSVKANTNTYFYKILAIDSCGLSSDTSWFHQPILLSVNQVGCKSSLKLNWNVYSGWASVKKQVIYRSVNNGPYTILVVVGGNMTTYIDTGLNHQNTYCYKILAYDNMDSFKSQSNYVCGQPFFPDTAKIITVTKISTSLTNGTVVIRWKSINKPNFAYSQLFYSRDGNNFAVLNSHILPSIDSFAQTGLNTQTSDQFYYLIIVDSCGQKSAIPSINKTITLTVSVGQLIHKLNWTPYQGFKIKDYKIEKLIGGKFQVIDSVAGTDTSSKYFPAPCNSIERYRIVAIGYDSGEISWSDTMGRQAIDTEPSNRVIIKNATVLSGTSARIDFRGSDSLDTYKYFIERSINWAWATAGRVLFNGPGTSLSYIDTGINTVKNHICYTIITLDSCLNATPTDTFCLMNLHGTALDDADSLHWNAFKGYGTELKDYLILRLKNSGGWDTIASVNGNDTTYFHAPIACNTSVTYKIAANNKTGSTYSLSDSITLTPFDTIKPPAPILYYTTVLPNQTVKLSWQWNTKSDVKYFEIWRTTNALAPVLIDTVVYDSVYIDKKANTQKNIYSYYIIAIDSCNTVNRSKPSVQNVLMSLKLYSLFCKKQVQINWTPYTGLPNGVNTYRIYRSTDGTNFSVIATISNSISSYIDTSVAIGTQYFYKVEAIDAKSGYNSFSDTLGTTPAIIPEASNAQFVYATVLKTDPKGGQIYIVWRRAALADTNARGYYVYSYDSTNKKYALLKDVTDLNDTTYINSNLNTLQNAYKYYIITYNVCDVGNGSNIHKTVLLSVINGNLTANLHWTNYLGEKVKNYSIYKSIDGGKQTLLKDAGLDSTDLDTNLYCNHTYTYQIQAILENGKISFSDSVTIKGQDTIKPITNPISLATVTATSITNGKILLRWLPANSPLGARGQHGGKIAGYNIFRSNDGINWQQILFTYPGISLVDSGLNTYRQPYFYRIQAVDSCGNVGAFSPVHKTINLKASAGNQFIQLNWNTYQGWEVKKYLVYKDGNLIATIGKDTTNFKDTLVVCTKTYHYLIKAVCDTTNDTLISFSNTDSIKSFDHKAPQKVYIKTVTVSNPNKAVTITWNPSASFDTKNYFVYRKSGLNGNMKLVDTTSQLSYIDSTSEIQTILQIPNNHGPDCYYVFAQDHCGNLSSGSNEGCIIILNAQNQQFYNNLNWNGYQTWYDDILNYNVYKKEDNQPWNLIGTTTSGSVHNFTDKDLGDSTINFCYQVEAVENQGQYNQLSRSTVACVHQDATVFIPNSFTHFNLDGLNDYFGPKGLYIKNYTMQIYNRWGELVYSTSESKPWDGTFKGAEALEGVYVYLITIEDYNAKKSSFNGNVTIFR